MPPGVVHRRNTRVAVAVAALILVGVALARGRVSFGPPAGGAPHALAPGTEPAAEPAVSGPCRPLYVVGDSEAATRAFELEADELCRRFGVRPVLRHPPFLSEELDGFVEQAGSEVDLVILAPSRLDVYVRKNLLLPLDAWIDEDDPWFTDILPAYRNLYMRFGSHYYGMVYDGDCHLLFYRQDIFSQHGLAPPSTWAEHDAAARALAREPGPGGARRYGTAMVGIPGKRYMWFAERFASYGGEYFDEQMRPLIAGPAGQRALAEWVALQSEVMPAATYDWADLNRAFLSGDLPMVIQWSDTARFTFDRSVWQSQVSGRVAWTLVPGDQPGAPRGGIWFGRILGVAARSTQPEVAARVARYMTGPDVSGRLITRADTINDPFRFSHLRHPEHQALFPDRALAEAFYRTLQAALTRPMADLTIPGGWEYTRVLDEAVGRALRGERSPAGALEEAAREWDSITDRYGRETQRQAFLDWRARLKGEREP